MGIFTANNGIKLLGRPRIAIPAFQSSVVEVFTSQTIIKPDGYSRAILEAIGGGAAGQTQFTDTNFGFNYGGAGGCSGEDMPPVIIDVSVMSGIIVNIGAGGYWNGSADIDGGTTSLVNADTFATLLQALGGRACQTRHDLERGGSGTGVGVSRVRQYGRNGGTGALANAADLTAGGGAAGWKGRGGFPGADIGGVGTPGSGPDSTGFTHDMSGTGANATAVAQSGVTAAQAGANAGGRNGRAGGGAGAGGGGGGRQGGTNATGGRGASGGARITWIK